MRNEQSGKETTREAGLASVRSASLHSAVEPLLFRLRGGDCIVSLLSSPPCFPSIDGSYLTLIIAEESTRKTNLKPNLNRSQFNLLSSSSSLPFSSPPFRAGLPRGFGLYFTIAASNEQSAGSLFIILSKLMPFDFALFVFIVYSCFFLRVFRWKRIV